jgi:hypothetical protein
MSKKLKSWGGRIGAISFGLALALVISEAGLWLANPALARNRNSDNRAYALIGLAQGFGWAQFFQAHPDLGWVHAPNVRLRQNNWGVETLMETNSLGMYDIDYTPTPPPNTYRLILLGDSYAEGAHVNRLDTFQQVLETCLNARTSPSGPRYEVLNLGVSGYGPSQYLTMLRQYGLGYQPDLVLVSLYPGNDYVDEMGNTFSDYAWGVPLRYLPTAEGGLSEVRYPLTLEIAPPSARHRSLYRHSALYRLYINWVTQRYLLGLRAQVEEGEGVTPENYPIRLPGTPDLSPQAVWDVMGRTPMEFYAALERGEEPPALQEMVGRVAAILRAIQTESLAQDAEFALIVMPLLSFNPTPQPARLAQAAKMPFLDLSQPLAGAVSPPSTPRDLFLLPDGHLNVAGHRAVGEILCEWLPSQGLLAD